MEGTCRRWKDDLELAGYEVSLFDIPAYSVGLQTLERHIWIVAQTTDIRFEGSLQESHTHIRSTKRKLQRGYQGEGGRRNISDTEFCRMDQRVSQKLDKDQKHRLIALGNAVPPQIPYEIFKAIEVLTQSTA